MSNEAVSSPPSELVEQRLRELKLVWKSDIPYRLDSLFPKLTGWGSGGEIKRRYKLIQLVEPTLKRMLLDGEEVNYIAKGVQYSLAENYFFGAMAALMNQTVFVLTNARLLLMRSNGSGKPAEMYWVIYYSEILDFKANWVGGLNLKLADGKKLKFNGFPTIDRKSMPSIFQRALDDYRRLDFAPDTSQSRENLCCRCFKVISKGEFTCEHCGAEYWLPRDLALRSLVFPSWGDLCMGHYLIAAIEMIGYLISWVIVANEFTKGNPVFGLVMIGAILVIEHPLDAVLTYIIASKGLNLRRNADPAIPVEGPLSVEVHHDRQMRSD